MAASQSRGYRRTQFAWREWQRRAGLDRLYPFHCLRHTAVTSVYRATRDLFLAQRFARHASPLTTTVYTHPSDEEMSAQLRELTCLSQLTTSTTSLWIEDSLALASALEPPQVQFEALASTEPASSAIRLWRQEQADF